MAGFLPTFSNVCQSGWEPNPLNEMLRYFKGSARPVACSMIVIFYRNDSGQYYKTKNYD